MIFIKAFIKCYPYLVAIAVICFVCYAVWISNIYYDILTALPLWMMIAYGAILCVAAIAVLTVIYIILRKRCDGIMNIYKLRIKSDLEIFISKPLFACYYFFV